MRMVAFMGILSACCAASGVGEIMAGPRPAGRLLPAVGEMSLCLQLGAAGPMGADRGGVPLARSEGAAAAAIPTEVHTLSNGLRVVFHTDRSDPIVAVAVMYHVGSARETVGKTGFAHLFEHILFQESQHLGPDQFFRRIQEVGGTLNGGTWEDGTIYYEVVPRNALETVLWMESDRMGWLLGALTQDSFQNQQNVVMNEKKQSYDNRPYGYTNYVIGKALYPEGHPYNWQVIGSLPDIAGATLDDVRQFFTTWYGPNNATLVIAGDISATEALPLVEKYFGEIRRRADVAPIVRQPGAVSRAVGSEEFAGLSMKDGRMPERLYYRDRLAKVPQLVMVWPTVPSQHEDEAPLAYLADMLATNKTDVLYRRLVEEKKLTSRVEVSNTTGEVAGLFKISVRPLPGVSLDAVEAEIRAGLAEFACAEVSGERLAGEKAKFEVSFMGQLESVFYKAMVLAMTTSFSGRPEALEQELERFRSVAPSDVKRVAMRYLLQGMGAGTPPNGGKEPTLSPYLALSVVPYDQSALAAAGSVEFPIPDDSGVALEAGTKDEGVPPPAPSMLDRSKAPVVGEPPAVKAPRPELDAMANGMALGVIVGKEVPLVRLSLVWRGGRTLERGQAPGIAYLTGHLLKEGTATLSPVQFQEAFDKLGASLQVSVGVDATEYEVLCLERSLPEVVALLSEMILKPRLDQREFDRLKARQLASIRQKNSDAANVAYDRFGELVFGKAHPAAGSVLGTEESVGAITLDEVRSFVGANLVPGRLHWLAVGDVEMAQLRKLLAPFAELKSGELTDDVPAMQQPAARKAIHVMDFPGAPQSEIRIGLAGLALNHPDYFPATVMNYGLGGNFASVINMILREEKGYTYGMRSMFMGGNGWGAFAVHGSVHTAATGESVQIILDAINGWQRDVEQAVVEFTRNSMLLGMAREFETLAQRMTVLRRVSVYGLPSDYIKSREKILAQFTADKSVELARLLMPLEKLVVLVAGDASVVVPQLEALGLNPVQVEEGQK